MVDLGEKSNNPDGIATNAVQSAIAFADAYTIRHLQQRSRGQDHHEVVTLISRVRTEESKRVASAIQEILNQKNLVEYGESDVSRADARDLARSLRKLANIVEHSFRG
jgi:hypothetical protein